MKFSLTNPNTHFLSYGVSRPYCLVSWSRMVMLHPVEVFLEVCWWVDCIRDSSSRIWSGVCIIPFLIVKATNTQNGSVSQYGSEDKVTKPWTMRRVWFIFLIMYTINSSSKLLETPRLDAVSPYVIKRPDSKVLKRRTSKSEYLDMFLRTLHINDLCMSFDV